MHEDEVPIVFPKTPTIVKVVTEDDRHESYRGKAVCLLDGFPAEVDVHIDGRYGNHFAVAQYFDGRDWIKVQDRRDGFVTEIHRRDLPEGTEDRIDLVNIVAMEIWYEADKIVHAARLRAEALDREEEFKKRAWLALGEQPPREIHVNDRPEPTPTEKEI